MLGLCLFSAHTLVFVPSKILQNLNVFYLSWVLQSPQAEKLKTMLMQNLGRGRGDKLGALWEMCKWQITIFKAKMSTHSTTWQFKTIKNI